jgi:hypothetical protein
MTYKIKMCAINSGTLHSCLDCRYILDPVGCRLFRTYSRIVYQKINRDIAELAIKDYLGERINRES